MDRKLKIKKRLQDKIKNKENEEKNDTNVEKKTPSLDNTKIFQAIIEFINDITSSYGEDDKMIELKAYDKLLSQTTLKHKKAIENHVNIFKNYCKTNEKSIMTKDENNIENIKYNDKITIDIKYIFSLAQQNDKSVIWQHLLTLLYYTNPTVELKSYIQNMTKKDGKDNESKFLENMIDKLQNNVSEESLQNPVNAMMGLLSSGVLGDLMSEAQQSSSSGNLNLKKLLGTVNKLVEQLSENEDDDIDIKNMIKNAKS